jgi:cytochrome c-type biogenesis protein CcmH/NrfG
VSAWVHLGHAYFDAGRFTQAITAYRKALALKPENADVWTDLGVMYRRNQQAPEALEAFDQALAVDPSHQAARFNKGIVLIHDLDQRPAGLAAWEKLLETNPLARAPNGQTVAALVAELRRTLEPPQAQSAPPGENGPAAPQN